MVVGCVLRTTKRKLSINSVYDTVYSGARCMKFERSVAHLTRSIDLTKTLLLHRMNFHPEHGCEKYHQPKISANQTNKE
jgi:endonuclease IV